MHKRSYFLCGRRRGACRAGRRPIGRTASAADTATCQLGTRARSDPARHLSPVRQHALPARRAEVPSDLEQMPHLLSFLKANGTLLHERPHHPDLAHRGRDPVLAHRPLSRTARARRSRTATTTSTAQAYRRSRARSSTGRTRVDPADDPLPNMITDGQKNTPAPWVPFTRAGCDVGGVGTANIELENARPRRPATSPRCSAPARRSGTRPRRTRSSARPTSSASRSTARRRREQLQRQREREARPASGRAGRLQRLQRALRHEVRRPGDHRRERVRQRHATAIRSRIRSATAASRASTGRSRRTRSATWRRCRSPACR